MTTWIWEKCSYIAGLLAIFVLFGLIILAANIEIKDLDLWLHLAMGRFIVQNQMIPAGDVLSCTISHQPWINHEWLFQALVYFISTIFGAEGLISLRVTVIVLTFLLLLSLGYNKDKQLASILALLLVLLTYKIRFTLRPDIFSLFFFALYIYLLAFHLDKRAILPVIFVLQVVWTNMHGFFVWGPLLVFIGLTAEWGKRHLKLPFEWNQTGRLNEKEYKRIKYVFICTLAACLFNPNFIEGALYPVGVLFSLTGESQIFFKHIGELQKPIDGQTLLSLNHFLYYKILIIVSTIGFVLNYRKIDLSALLLWTVFLIFSLNATRNVGYFALAAYFVILLNAQYISLDSYLPPQLKKKKLKYFCSIVIKVFCVIWMINYISAISLRGYYDFDNYERKSEFGGISKRNYPYKAVNFLIANKIGGNFFNDFNSGAYLLGRAHPAIKVFIDGRTEVYGADFFKEYNKIWYGDEPLFKEYAERYGITGAFLNSVYVPAPEELIKHLYRNKEWVLVYFDYDASIFLKNVEQNKPIIEKYAIDLKNWKTEELDLFKIGTQKVTPYRYWNRAAALYNLGLYDEALNETNEALRVAPNYAKAYKLKGKVYIEKKNYTQALEFLRKAKILSPNDNETHFYLGVAFYHLDQFDLAKKECIKVLQVRPKNHKGLFLLALIYAKEKRYEQTIEMLSRARSAAPEKTSEFLEVVDVLREQKADEWVDKASQLLTENE